LVPGAVDVVPGGEVMVPGGVLPADDAITASTGAHEVRSPRIASSTALTAPLGAASGLAPDTALIPASSLSLRTSCTTARSGKKIFRPNGRRFTAGLKA